MGIDGQDFLIDPLRFGKVACLVMTKPFAHQIVRGGGRLLTQRSLHFSRRHLRMPNLLDGLDRGVHGEFHHTAIGEKSHQTTGEEFWGLKERL